jgi:hypothetical protein
MSSMLVKTYHKAAVERRRLYMDYTCWLADDETLTGFQVGVVPYTADAPVVVDVSYPDVAHKKLMMFVSGGKGNTSYTLSMVVNTDSGQIKRDDIGMKVSP